MFPHSFHLYWAVFRWLPPLLRSLDPPQRNLEVPVHVSSTAVVGSGHRKKALPHRSNHA